MKVAINDVVSAAERGRGHGQSSLHWPSLRVVFGLLVAVGLFGRGLWLSWQHPVSAKPVFAAGAPASRATFTPIEDIRVGQRVVTSGESEAGNETAVDPATWRLLEIRATLRLEDGTLDVVEIETLQPAEVIQEIGATLGAIVPIPLDLAEMQLPQDLEGVVVRNEPCPRIQKGSGRVVLTTVNHLNPAVLELALRDSDGRQETVGATGPHRFYSETRSDWVAAEDLRQGEQLRGLTGPVTVVASKPLPGMHRVYNMSVETDHVYRVSSLGTLVHNTYPARTLDIKPNTWQRAGDSISFDDAVGHVRNGGDVVAAGKDMAKDIATKAGKGPPIHNPPHRPGQFPHYHPNDGTGNQMGPHVAY